MKVSAGVDIGSTSIKVVLIDEQHLELATLKEPQDWASKGDLITIDLGLLTNKVEDMIYRVNQQIDESHTLVGIGITGMAEVGTIVDTEGHALSPGVAWYDPHGAEQLELLPSELRDSFSQTTGLSFKAECSLSKILWFRDNGLQLEPGCRWLNAQEFVAYRLTGNAFTEPSLASRTGLLDQSTQLPWVEMLRYLNVSPDFVPEFRPAGKSWGLCSHAKHESLRQAKLVVAGHDHLVAAVGAGATKPNSLFNSCGTADVLIRSIPGRLSPDQRQTLVQRGISSGMHVLPGTTAIFAATRAGLALNRVFTALGAETLEDKVALTNSDSTATSSGPVEISMPKEWINSVSIELRGEATPKSIASSVVAYAKAETARVVEATEEIVGPHEAEIGAGGWLRLPAVWAAKKDLMPNLVRASHDEPGCSAAAAYALNSTYT